MEQPSTYKVGKDVLSFCSKCNLTLSHMIMCMLDQQCIAKVKCNTCGSEHKYKDPSLSTLKVKVGVKKVGAKRAPSKTSLQNAENLWEKSVKESNGRGKAYSIKMNFNIGDLIDHSKFGLGVVENKLEGDKINVVFRVETKTLIHNKK